MNMAAGSMSVDQEATAVSGQNLANVNNPAYAEEQLQIEESAPDITTNGEEGTGVTAGDITELRNALLDAQITSEGGVTGSLTAQQTALDQVEAYLDEQISSSSSSSGSTESANGIAADLSNFFDSLQTLSTDPSNLSDQQAVVQAAQQLTEQFNQVSSGLSTVQSDLNSTIQSSVTTANQDLSQIASLNQQIVVAQSEGGTADQLVDQREQLLENLGGLVNITTSTQSNGAVNVSISGVNMIDGNSVTNSLGTYTDANGNLQINAARTGTDLTLTSGSIEGNITARDGALATLQGSLNTLASQLITQVNTIYSPGYDVNGGSGQKLFTGSTAADIGVNSSLVNDPSTFQGSASGAAGDNSIVVALANLANTSLSALNNQTLSNSYATTVGTFGSALQSVNDQLDSSNSVAQMLQSQRSSYGGVDTDTEMTNLLQYQKAYEASAELVTTVNQMAEAVINMDQ